MEPSDADLIARIVVAGDRTAFTLLVRRHQAFVRSLLLHLCRDHALADDLVQETFVKLFTNLDRYSGEGAFRSWLGGIAYRQFLMAARRQRSHDNKLDLYAAVPLTATVSVPENASSLDLDRALARLPEQQRAAIILSYGCDMSHPEIAREMKAPLGTVKSWLAQAKALLRDQLASSRPEE